MMIKKGNLFAGIPSGLTEEIFEPLIERNSLKIERIITEGQTTPCGEFYDQTADEWVALLRGNATITFPDEGESIELNAGDYIFIPAHMRHRVDSASADPSCVWLAFHFTGQGE